MRVLGISGSLRADSYNSGLLRAAADVLPPGAELEIFDGLKAIPPYDADDDLDFGPAPVRDAARRDRGGRRRPDRHPRVQRVAPGRAQERARLGLAAARHQPAARQARRGGGRLDRHVRRRLGAGRGPQGARDDRRPRARLGAPGARGRRALRRTAGSPIPRSRSGWPRSSPSWSRPPRRAPRGSPPAPPRTAGRPRLVAHPPRRRVVVLRRQSSRRRLVRPARCARPGASGGSPDQSGRSPSTSVTAVGSARRRGGRGSLGGGPVVGRRVRRLGPVRRAHAQPHRRAARPPRRARRRCPTGASSRLLGSSTSGSSNSRQTISSTRPAAGQRDRRAVAARQVEALVLAARPHEEQHAGRHQQHGRLDEAEGAERAHVALDELARALGHVRLLVPRQQQRDHHGSGGDARVAQLGRQLPQACERAHTPAPTRRRRSFMPISLKPGQRSRRSSRASR